VFGHEQWQNCNANTTTAKATNIDGQKSTSSAGTQRFHNASAINGSIQSGVRVSGFGLQLTEKRGAMDTQEPITLNDQGQVTISSPANTLQLHGDGGLR
jgi:hypothetical protein